jgi:hypothetical protein
MKEMAKLQDAPLHGLKLDIRPLQLFDALADSGVGEGREGEKPDR